MFGMRQLSAHIKPLKNGEHLLGDNPVPNRYGRCNEHDREEHRGQYDR